MNKKIKFILLAVLLLLLAAAYFFKFTLAGQTALYNAFGGSDLRLSSGEKELYWFDVQHSNSSDSPMFARIESSVAEFKPDLILVEGGFNTFDGTREEAILEGESAFAAFIAKQNGIAVEDIEPPFGKQIEYLSSKYSPGDILAMYLLRQIRSVYFMPENSEVDFNSLIVNETRRLREYGLSIEVTEAADILAVINARLTEPLDASDWRNYDKNKMAAVFDDGALKPIYDDVVEYRNIYLIELIAEKKTSHDRIYIVMGGAHLRETKDRLLDLYP